MVRETHIIYSCSMCVKTFVRNVRHKHVSGTCVGNMCQERVSGTCDRKEHTRKLSVVIKEELYRRGHRSHAAMI